ncbi:MAG: hypothetical protein ACREP9_10075, partial [Candidatus Dormibacteraceae bacterium]
RPDTTARAGFPAESVDAKAARASTVHDAARNVTMSKNLIGEIFRTPATVLTTDFRCIRLGIKTGLG